ncbi:MAG: inositol monophosphatase [Candidatus Doudnabacteria bacterium]|nr:inositol monophosphatase [Candidatus Doudnabacteria bacterium]
MEKFIKNLARDAGRILRDGFRSKLKINYKSGNIFDIVTQYDLKSKEFIIGKILQKYPRHGIMAEESGYNNKRDNIWIIDPLDGTRAFSRGIPQFSVSIAFVSRNKIQLGVIYDPIHDELFFGQSGRGSRLNARRMLVNPTQQLTHALTFLQFVSNKIPKLHKRVFRFMAERDVTISQFGSTALAGANVACGRFDAVVSNRQSPWDIAAAGLILREAGAKVTDFDNQPYSWQKRQMLAANSTLHKQIIKILN